MDDLNWMEARIVETLRSKGRLTLVQLGKRCFPGVPPRERRLSRVRNGLRKPMRLGLIRRVDNGTYEA